MKRFRSNLQKVHDIFRQQSRMAELELARTRSLWMAAQNRVEQAIVDLECARVEVNRSLLRTRQSTLIIGMHQHLGAAGDRVSKAQEDARKAEQVCEQARKQYQEIHSKVERIESLIEKQRDVHRREVLVEQQQVMDDVAIFRWNQPEHLENEVSRHG